LQQVIGLRPCREQDHIDFISRNRGNRGA
jgi:hypothetical protein